LGALILIFSALVTGPKNKQLTEQGKYPWSSGSGRRLMTERFWVQTPTVKTIFSGTIHLDQSLESKIEWKLTWYCSRYCNPVKGRVDSKDVWLIKSSLIRMK
jgi:hypothetical protein